MQTTTTQTTPVMVFKTDVMSSHDVATIRQVLDYHPYINQWTIDLQDWEKVLCIQAQAPLSCLEVEKLLAYKGYFCKPMDH